MLFSLFIFTWFAGSIFYVFKLRGEARYASFTQYLRKSWPIFAPFNSVLYLFTRKQAQGAFIDPAQYKNLHIIKENYSTILEEAKALFDNGNFCQTNEPGSPGYYDVGFRTFFKYGWSKFYLNWYGYQHESAKRLCPKTQAILAQIPEVKGAMFSILPPHSQLTIHSDPLACSLRYHFGLMVPNSPECYINVDNKSKHWMDGEGFIFDETFPHFVRNDTDQHRLILMCDVERPMSLPGRVFNYFYGFLVRTTVVPNTAEDKIGKASALFAKVSPLLADGKALKKTNPPLYKLIKYSLNTSLLLAFFFIIFAVYELIAALI